jgi:hypothetical protein
MICTEAQYIHQYSDPKAQLIAIQAIIAALDVMISHSISIGSVKDYSLDEGQIQIKATYNSILDVIGARKYYTQEAQRMVNQINGRETIFSPCIPYGIS